MAVTDPIADLLTRVRNAIKAKKRRVDVPASKMKAGVIQILKEQNFIQDFALVEDNKQNVLRIALKYTNGISAISGIKRISTPGLRVYADVEHLPRVLNGYGMSVISTPKGLLSDRQARKENVGGEIICEIW
ncbi:MAG: 30S ribosomal protein S8 [Ignavibacteriales bacterium]|nr:30S ribosomal protein S8 [Ignavibacteriales bacterium]